MSIEHDPDYTTNDGHPEPPGTKSWLTTVDATAVIGNVDLDHVTIDDTLEFVLVQ